MPKLGQFWHRHRLFLTPEHTALRRVVNDLLQPLTQISGMTQLLQQRHPVRISVEVEAIMTAPADQAA